MPLSPVAPTGVRPAAVAGTFYSGNASSLRRDLERHLGAVSPALTFTDSANSAEPSNPTAARAQTGRLKAIIVPHAGYIYSGQTAGRAFALLTQWAASIRRVVLLGPTHRVAVQGIAVSTASHFATPLGKIALDRDAIDALADLPQIVSSDAAHAQEHSLEVQLPFLQSVLGDFLLIPLAIGDTTTSDIAEVLDRLWGGDDTVIVASSDLSHYHSYQEAQRLDRETARTILTLDPLTSFDQACGALAINGLLHVARKRGLRIVPVAQCNSGDTAGDKSRVVGYASFALYEPPPKADELGTSLLSQARHAIASQFGPSPGPASSATAAHRALTEPGATFVTLMLDGHLRGCIGSLEAHRPLADDVRANAIAAAFRDPRFAPLSATELPRLKIEVSLLSTPVPLHFTSETDALRQLRPGIDGIILIAGHARGTFLPQVWEQLPSPPEFLAHLKQKAGLSRDWWSNDVKLFRYEVQKWKE